MGKTGVVGFEALLRRAWTVFRGAARAGRTVTYLELAEALGPPVTRRSLHRQLLNELSARCERAGLPNLTALVVRKDSGKPGGGWCGVGETEPGAAWGEAVTACWAYAWPALVPSGLLESGEPARGRNRMVL